MKPPHDGQPPQRLRPYETVLDPAQPLWQALTTSVLTQTLAQQGEDEDTSVAIRLGHGRWVLVPLN